MKHNILFLLFLQLLSNPSLLPGADYLLLIDPKGLIVYDQFEQRLSGKQIQHIAPMTPMKIVDYSTNLSDNFTVCVKTAMKGLTYYLLKETYYSGLKAKSLIKITNTITIDDTVVITSNNRVLLDFQLPIRTANRYLAAGDSLVRIFRKGGRYFVQQIYPSLHYGWIKAGLRKHWKHISALPVQARGSDDAIITAKIVACLDEANLILADLCSYFNQATTDSIKIPQWIMTKQDNRFVCTISNKPAAADFSESTAVLAYRLQNLLNNSRAVIQARQDTIFIVAQQQK